MPFDRQRRMVYLHIPKTAGTSVEKAIGLYGVWNEECLNSGFGLIQSRDLLAKNLSSNFLQHLTLMELRALFPDVLKNAQLFTVVRDPWRRLLSSFQNPDPDLCNYYKFRTHRELSDLSLAEYIDVARWLPHPHLRPQIDYLISKPGEKPDRAIRIFHQENLGHLEEWLKSTMGTKVQIRRHNTSKRALPGLSNTDWQTLEQQVRLLYSVDAQAFGYDL